MAFFYQNGFKLGILGGGQLGRMLIQECINLNVSTGVLDPDPNAPCKSLCDEFVCGNFNDYDTVYVFGKTKNLITIEIEHVNLDALFQLQKEGVKVYPQPEILKTIKDKGLQKQFYQDNGLPTSPFHLVKNKVEAEMLIAELPMMMKLRSGGYDGKGVVPVRNKNDFDNAFDQPSVMEKMVDFEREISVIVARNSDGNIVHYPVVDMEFNPKANLVEFLFSPSEIESSVQEKAIELARKVIELLGMVGLLAVEFFVTKSGEVLINEMAPRPHNSGHQTIEGNRTSQYAQHLRAILNLPLGSTEIIYPSVMINILGEPGYEGDAIYEKLNEVVQMPGTYVHLYGKKTTKPFRKMGHVTIVGKNMDQNRRQAQLVKQLLKVKA